MERPAHQREHGTRPAAPAGRPGPGWRRVALIWAPRGRGRISYTVLHRGPRPP